MTIFASFVDSFAFNLVIYLYYAYILISKGTSISLHGISADVLQPANFTTYAVNIKTQTKRLHTVMQILETNHRSELEAEGELTLLQ